VGTEHTPAENIVGLQMETVAAWWYSGSEHHCGALWCRVYQTIWQVL